jgi:hypothetical protein
VKRIAAALALAAALAAPAVASASAQQRLEAKGYRFTSVRHTPIGTVLRGARYVDGVRVGGSSAVIARRNGRDYWVRAARGTAAGRPARDAVAARTASATALGHLGVGAPTRVHAERLLTARGDVFRVAVFSLHPAIAKTVDVDAATGRVRAVRDDNRYDDAVGTVFDPNPIVTARDNTLREPGVDESGVDTDLDSAELTAQLKDLPILGYDATQAPLGRLVGPWVQVQGAQPYVALGGRIELTRGMPGFEGLMAYAHIDRYQRYLQDTLGFKDVNAEPQDLYALPVEGYDNSFYQPGNDLMLLGAGGVDDGEDAEVILHEYGHAVQDAQVPGWGANEEGGAMGEGFGDFQSGAYFARTSGGFQDVCLMDWDSTSYSTGTPPCIRRMDSDKVWPKDKAGEVHDDGEIWETYLWRLRSHLGSTAVEMSDNALTLVLSSHELLGPDATFAKAVAALKTAATALGHPEWVEYVVAEARTSGFVA